MDEPAYRRVVVKLSGEYLAGSQSFGIDQPTIDRIADDLTAARKLGVEIAVVIGNPYFTTDTTAVLRAAEIGAQAVLKATNVDGVYSSDPKKDPSAKRFERLSHSQALEGGYKVMDATAFALARETSLPIIVFSIAEPGSIGAILRGAGRGTIVAS
jgi:uridylate kinase